MGNSPLYEKLHICDREADFFQLFDEQRKNPSVDLLIRAKQDRIIVDDLLIRDGDEKKSKSNYLKPYVMLLFKAKSMFVFQDKAKDLKKVSRKLERNAGVV